MSNKHMIVLSIPFIIADPWCGYCNLRYTGQAHLSARLPRTIASARRCSVVNTPAGRRGVLNESVFFHLFQASVVSKTDMPPPTGTFYTFGKSLESQRAKFLGYRLIPILLNRSKCITLSKFLDLEV